MAYSTYLAKRATSSRLDLSPAVHVILLLLLDFREYNYKSRLGLFLDQIEVHWGPNKSRYCQNWEGRIYKSSLLPISISLFALLLSGRY